LGTVGSRGWDGSADVRLDVWRRMREDLVVEEPPHAAGDGTAGSMQDEVDQIGRVGRRLDRLGRRKKQGDQVRHRSNKGRSQGPGGGRRPAVAAVRRSRSDADGEDLEWSADHPAGQPPLTLSITVYLSDEAVHEEIEAAVEGLLASAGIQITERDDPIIGSWFRRMRARSDAAPRSPVAREAAMAAVHAADTRLVHSPDAQVTATLLQNLGPVIAALQPTKDAVIRAGALLIVKVDWVIAVHQLTAAQQLELDHHPSLAASPHEILTALQLPSLTSVQIPAEGGRAAQLP